MADNGTRKGQGNRAPLPVTVCYGAELYLMNRWIAALIEKNVEEEHRELAVSKYDLAETPLDVVLEDAETLPFFVPRKVIVASRAHFFTGAKESGKIEHRVERLLEYVKAPVEHSILVFTVEADKLDERKKLVKTFKELGAVQPFSALSSDELNRWAARHAEELGFSFGTGAAEMLALYTGGQLQAMASEMEKLSLYAGKGGKVTEAMVDELVARSTEQNVFLLIEEIVQRRIEKAFAIMYELLKQREEPIKIAVLMARQFRLIWQVKELERQGYSQQQIAGHLGSHPFPIKLAAEQGRKYDNERLQRIMTQLAELDYNIKSGRIEKVLGLEMFILHVAA
ncbi:DNA polymerase III subunit delta [Paenibacillus sp. MBLB4367]|uniref:DNA polymerase III subunit delta n=1 Tax=Paenibacillus sp. MBLB4367 TaxID=3384767 RepID=UPI003908405C